VSSHTELRESLGAYVLDALDPDESTLVRDHLRDCPDCRVEYDRLADLPDVLRLVPEMAWRDEAPPELTLARLLDRVRTERELEQRGTRRRLWLATAAAGAVAAAVVGVAGVVWTHSGDDGAAIAGSRPNPTAPTRTLEGTSSNGSIHGRVEVVPVGWGSRLDVELDGVAPGSWCELQVVDTSGHHWDGGSWWVPDTPKALYWSGGVALTADDIAEVNVLAENGARLLSLRS
jgi:Putative zinc-finger